MSRRHMLVYFIQAGDDGPIKIGETAHRSPTHRLFELQAGNHRELFVRATQCDLWSSTPTRSLERQLHASFDHLRIHREWFLPARDLLVYIRKLADFDGTESGVWVPRQIDKESSEETVVPGNPAPLLVGRG